MTPELRPSRRRLVVLLLLCFAVALSGCAGWGTGSPAEDPDVANAGSGDIDDEQDGGDSSDGTNATNASGEETNAEESDSGGTDGGDDAGSDDGDPNADSDSETSVGDTDSESSESVDQSTSSNDDSTVATQSSDDSASSASASASSANAGSNDDPASDSSGTDASDSEGSDSEDATEGSEDTDSGSADDADDAGDGSSDNADDGADDNTDETGDESSGSDDGADNGDESSPEEPPANESEDDEGTAEDGNTSDENTPDENESDGNSSEGNESDDPETYTLTVEAEGPVTIERLSDGATTTREATDGTVEFTVLEDMYEISAEQEEYVDPMLSIGVAEDRTITLQQGDSITYTVLDAGTGEPIEGAEISGMCDLWYSSGDAYITGESNASGELEAETLSPTTCRYDTQIAAEGYEPASLGEIDIPEDDGTTVELQPEESDSTAALALGGLGEAPSIARA